MAFYMFVKVILEFVSKLAFVCIGLLLLIFDCEITIVFVSLFVGIFWFIRLKPPPEDWFLLLALVCSWPFNATPPGRTDWVPELP